MTSEIAATSRFHPGEQALQARLGMRNKVEAMGQKIIRDLMPDQHQDFFAGLPFIFAGYTDKDDRPWGSVLSGPVGFMSAPDPATLAIKALPVEGDPLAEYLEVGQPLGFLGLEFHTRRRNRMNGRIAALDEGGLTISVDQSFGNCPKYIQTRALIAAPVAAPGNGSAGGSLAENSIEDASRLGDAERRLIENADTFFIASARLEDTGERSDGVDISHRGGNPGFVRIDGDGALIIPDFSGNFMFNTLGNIEETGRAGYTFTDFESGDLLQLTGAADSLWEETIDGWYYERAQRYLRFRPQAARWIRRGFPAPWRNGTLSPFLDNAAEWVRV